MKFDNSTPNMIFSISMDITRPRGAQKTTGELLGRPKMSFSNKKGSKNKKVKNLKKIAGESVRAAVVDCD